MTEILTDVDILDVIREFYGGHSANADAKHRARLNDALVALVARLHQIQAK